MPVPPISIPSTCSTAHSHGRATPAGYSSCWCRWTTPGRRRRLGIPGPRGSISWVEGLPRPAEPRGRTMPGFRDLLAKVKQKIREVDPAEAETRLDDATFLDVRELDEYEQGTVSGSVFIPRGHLESQVENKIPNKDQPVVVYCAAGNRSAFAAETLQELGYTDVASMAGGFGRW